MQVLRSPRFLLRIGGSCLLLAGGCFNPKAPTSDDEDSGSMSHETMGFSDNSSDGSPDAGDVPPTCGNGRVDAAELCDATATMDVECAAVGNFIGGVLGCRDDCREYDVSGCISQGCGNDMLEVGEQCEPGLALPDSCESLGYVSGELSCAANCTFAQDNCVATLCGDGEVDEGEECDTETSLSTTCGDLGYDEGTLSCSEDCTFDRSACVRTSCGNGDLEDGEECEPTLMSAIDCSALPDASFDSGMATCSETSCSFITSDCGRCGNGRVENEEECDDGNGVDTDDCTISCERPPDCGTPDAPLVVSDSGATAIAANSFAVYWTNTSGEQFEFRPDLAQPRRLDRTVAAETSGLDADDTGMIAFGSTQLTYTALPGGDAGWANSGVEIRLAALSGSYVFTALNGGPIEYLDRDGAYQDDEAGFVDAVDGDPSNEEFYAGIDEGVYRLSPGSFASASRTRAFIDALALSRDFVAWSTRYVAVAIGPRNSSGEVEAQEPGSPSEFRSATAMALLDDPDGARTWLFVSSDLGSIGYSVGQVGSTFADLAVLVSERGSIRDVVATPFGVFWLEDGAIYRVCRPT